MQTWNDKKQKQMIYDSTPKKVIKTQDIRLVKQNMDSINAKFAG